LKRVVVAGERSRERVPQRRPAAWRFFDA
jgi:hypothetical protein